MSLPRSFIKAATPILSILLILAGILQLRAQLWVTGAICILLALAGFIFSIRLLERSPFNAEETEALRPWILPMVLWTIVVSLLLISVLYVADNFVSTETNRIADLAWVISVVLGLIIIWQAKLRSDTFLSLWERIKANQREALLL